MTLAETKAFILLLVAELTSTKCIWENQNAPKPTNNYIGLNLSPERSIGTERRGRSDGTGVLDIIGRKETTLSVNAFGSGSVDICNLLWQRLNRPTIVDRCFVQGIAFVRSENVQDLTELLDGRSWEERANVDLIVTYSRSIIDEPGYITTVDLTGELGEPDAVTPVTDSAIAEVTINMKGVQ